MLNKRYLQDHINNRVPKESKEWRKFVDDFKLIVKEGDYEYLNCQICNSDNKLQISQKDYFGIDHNVYICKDCGLTYVYPIYNKSFTNIFYKKYYRRLYQFNEFEHKFDRFTAFKDRPNFIYNQSKVLNLNINSVIEVGCGEGVNLYPFFLNDCKILGIDLSDIFFKYAKEYGLKLEARDLLSINEKYDLVIASHVLEHVNDLEEFLQSIKNVLNIDGTLYIEVPGFGDIKEKRNYNYLQTLQNAHNFYFSKNSLKNLMYKYGFIEIYIDDYVRSFWKLNKNNKDSHNVILINCFEEDLKMYKKYECIFYFKYLLIRKILRLLGLFNIAKKIKGILMRRT